MTDTNPTPYDDEISVSELMMKLWAKRGLIVFLPLILAGLTIVGLLVSKTTQQGVLSYYLELNGIAISNTVSNADAEANADADADAEADAEMAVRYPNGVVFSPQDLVNPAVLADLASQYKKSVSELAENLDVQFGTPLSRGVQLEYEAALVANKNADAPTIAAINDRYQQKISATAKRGLKISVGFVALDLSRDAGEQLAVDLANAWNRIFTTQFKTRFNPEVISSLPRDAMDLTSTVGFLAAENQLKLVEKGAEVLAQDGRLAGLTDSSGFTAYDLLGYLTDFRTIYFDPLYLNAFAQRSALSDLYFRDTQLEIDELSDEIEELNIRLSNIQTFQQGGSGKSGATKEGGSAQFDSSGLNAVVSLAEKAALSGYLEQTLNLRSALSTERSVLKKRLRRISNATQGGANAAISEEFIQVAVDRYEEVMSSYGALIELARDMLIKQTPSYFSPITEPDTLGKWLELRDFLFIALALALGGMLAIIAALVWPQRDE